MASSRPVSSETDNGLRAQTGRQRRRSPAGLGLSASTHSLLLRRLALSAAYALAAVCALLFVVGVLLRVWLLGNAPMNSDEATAGLVAT